MKLYVKNSIIDLSHTHVMGILNITPDSFYDGGLYNTITKVLTYVDVMVNSGATIIDVGGESTRPGADEVSTEEELSRIISVIEAIVQRFEVLVSVNTSKPKVMREAARAGVHIINDIRSLTEKGALAAAAETDLPICLMHMQGCPKTMQEQPKYADVFSEVNSYFAKQIERCMRAGIAKQRLLLDPGFGFGKSLSHNYELLARLSNFHHFDLPLLVGISRKSMVGQLLQVGPNECLYGSLACAVIAAMQGAHIIRVHDVKETVEVLRVVKATLLASNNTRKKN